MPELTVATLNVRAVYDRWEERLPLLLADMAALQPQVLGLQEVVFPAQQDRLLGAAGPAAYRVLRNPAGRPEFGNSLLVREPVAILAEWRTDLGLDRAAMCAELRWPDGPHLACCVTHLHHPPAAHRERLAQVDRLTRWLDEVVGHDRPTVVLGDFNAPPDSAAYAAMIEHGFRSAYHEARGGEPPVTWPSGLMAPAIDTDGPPACLDYVWMRGPLQARSARLAFDRPAAHDPGLYPSDHFGIAATLLVG